MTVGAGRGQNDRSSERRFMNDRGDGGDRRRGDPHNGFGRADEGRFVSDDRYYRSGRDENEDDRGSHSRAGGGHAGQRNMRGPSRGREPGDYSR